MSNCLLVLNPRDITECVASIGALPIDKAWLRSYTEVQLIDAIAEVIDSTQYDNYIVVSDDVVVPRVALRVIENALRASSGLLDAVFTGYCNLALTDWRVNLCKTPVGDDPHPRSYDFITYQDAVSAPIPLGSYFAGMCLTGMSRELWQRFPFGCFGVGQHAGNASDLHLSLRLQEASVPVLAPPEAFCLHVKQNWNEYDQEPRKAFRWDRPQEVIWERA